MPYYNDYLAHYGVKGMKWGVRKKRDPVTKWGQRRATTRAHNEKIKSEWQRQKSLQKQGKVSKSDASYQNARRARTRNLAGRAAAASTGFGKSLQGRYYQHRENGKSVTEAALRTYGRQVAVSVAAGAALNVGRTLVTQYLRNR